MPSRKARPSDLSAFGWQLFGAQLYQQVFSRSWFSPPPAWILPSTSWRRIAWEAIGKSQCRAGVKVGLGDCPGQGAHAQYEALPLGD